MWHLEGIGGKINKKWGINDFGASKDTKWWLNCLW
jgi:hypothetical protein